MRNVEVLRKMQEERELVVTIKKHTLQYLGHVMSGGNNVTQKNKFVSKQHSLLFFSVSIPDFFHSFNLFTKSSVL